MLASKLSSSAQTSRHLRIDCIDCALDDLERPLLVTLKLLVVARGFVMKPMGAAPLPGTASVGIDIRALWEFPLGEVGISKSLLEAPGPVFAILGAEPCRLKVAAFVAGASGSVKNPNAVCVAFGERAITSIAFGANAT